ncbi:two component system response regulator [Trinickia caryophylli]|uniref:Two component transcriptional regulator, LuxR family n=1 Tax=Trinickia caryophylli TaxID=28094 RepID=A0A1X7EX86_TRICW|nr:two component system response regulator [Trinickia caryophylli]PMS09735.1 DNA-binding response regulator [Trinickia caryophylli]TRX18464.1 two component system response regulator [Trinickia caryophylli]WQE10750.1 two component system response regulator [Trinickia caryophylli]SMF41420.1 two component transcriptional regulator, LuxR family [Trinickia caryophylli]GLU33125.1 DNA-binding response regulator [Trinickia caryophylli]
MQITPNSITRKPPRASRVLIVEDHALLREGIKAALRSNDRPYDIVGEVDDGLAVYSACILLRPDIVLLDLGLPGMNGLEVIYMLKRRWPQLIVVILTADVSESRARDSIAAGANAYVLKAGSGETLLRALHEAASGTCFIDPALDRTSVHRQAPGKAAGTLTTRERQVLQLIAQGERNRGIAEKLCISIKTVETHRLNLMRKLDVHSAVELTNWAHRLGLVLTSAA